ncbi:MAG: hypothetical protein E7290_00660 [Lachnospiraceae bacterium]|nr:hypothetical protein [Lachnospiraceae bacterium]
MAISPIVLNGTISNTHDVLHQQTRQVDKGVQDQGQIVAQEVKQEFQKARQVVHSDNAEFMKKKHDAKEKGNGSYQGDGGRNRKHAEPEGRVVKKPEGGFDMKV